MFYGIVNNANRVSSVYECVAYNTYKQKKALLETCTDGYQRVILEAQIDVLREVSVKDIIHKIKETIVNAIKKLIEKIKGLIKKIFPGKSKDKLEEAQKKSEETLKKAENIETKEDAKEASKELKQRQSEVDTIINNFSEEMDKQTEKSNQSYNDLQNQKAQVTSNITDRHKDFWSTVNELEKKQKETKETGKQIIEDINSLLDDLDKMSEEDKKKFSGPAKEAIEDYDKQRSS